MLKEVEPELLRLLLRLGYMAAWQGWQREAVAIFQAVRAARPQSELPAIGAAVLAMMAGNSELAVQMLREEALRLNPDSDYAKAHLGCALRLNGQDEEGLKLLTDLEQNSTEPSVREMAQNLRQFSRTQLLQKSDL